MINLLPSVSLNVDERDGALTNTKIILNTAVSAILPNSLSRVSAILCDSASHCIMGNARVHKLVFS